MPQAARTTDMTAHGTPLSPGPGSSNVLIGGLPAWRATVDTHSCPLPYHGGGVVVVGSLTVLINDMPAARVGDVVVEALGPNAIVLGCPTVIIG